MTRLLPLLFVLLALPAWSATNTVTPLGCTGTQKVREIQADGTVVCATDQDAGEGLNVGNRSWVSVTGTDSATCGALSDPCATVTQGIINVGHCTVTNECEVFITEGYYQSHAPITLGMQCEADSSNAGDQCDGTCSTAGGTCSSDIDCPSGETCNSAADVTNCGASNNLCESKSFLTLRGEYERNTRITTTGTNNATPADPSDDLYGIDVSNTKNWKITGLQIDTLGATKGVVGSDGNAIGGTIERTNIASIAESERIDRNNLLHFEGWGNVTNIFWDNTLFSLNGDNDACAYYIETGTGSSNKANCDDQLCNSGDFIYGLNRTQTTGPAYCVMNATASASCASGADAGKPCRSSADCDGGAACTGGAAASTGGSFNTNIIGGRLTQIGDDIGDSACVDPSASAPPFSDAASGNPGYTSSGGSSCTVDGDCNAAPFTGAGSCDTDTNDNHPAFLVACTGVCQGGSRDGERCIDYAGDTDCDGGGDCVESVQVGGDNCTLDVDIINDQIRGLDQGAEGADVTPEMSIAVFNSGVNFGGSATFDNDNVCEDGILRSGGACPGDDPTMTADTGALSSLFGNDIMLTEVNSIDDLADVVITTPAQDEVIQLNASLDLVNVTVAAMLATGEVRDLGDFTMDDGDVFNVSSPVDQSIVCYSSAFNAFVDCSKATLLPDAFDWFDAASCPDGSTAFLNGDTLASGAPTAACDVGTNVSRGVATFPASGTTAMQRSGYVPLGWNGSTVPVHITWYSAATTGRVVWRVDLECIEDDGSRDPALNTTSNTTIGAAGVPSGTGGNLVKGTFINNITPDAGCDPGDEYVVRIQRLGDNGSEASNAGDQDAFLVRWGFQWPQ